MQPASQGIPNLPPHAVSSLVIIHLGAGERGMLGVGCLVDRQHVLTSRAVVQQALERTSYRNYIFVSPVGNLSGVVLPMVLLDQKPGREPDDGLAMLQFAGKEVWEGASAAEFATPLILENKMFVVQTFSPDQPNGVADTCGWKGKRPGGRWQLTGYHADRAYMGAPVWSPDLGAFVGLVDDRDPTLCITSARICEVFPDIGVISRIPEADRPKIKNYSVDDPNAEMFGNVSDNGRRRLTATLVERHPDGFSRVRMKYEVLPNSPAPAGRFVTFLTYPDMKDYELIAELDSSGKAEVEASPFVPDFTIAAIGDGGETRLTLNLMEIVKPEAAPVVTSEQIAEPGEEAREEPAESSLPSQSAEVDFLKKILQKDSIEPVPEYQLTYTRFETDLVAFDPRNLKTPLKDALGNAEHARHLAQLITARETPLPLSLGLFGDWGTGKSYFMRLLHQEIDSLSANKAHDEFCRKVVQIHFNAWHYLDTNLWANLVCEIFDNLFQALTDREDTPNEKVERLKKKLADESALAAEAKKALDDAKKARETAEEELKQAAKKREEQEKSVAAFIDDLSKVATDAGLSEQLKKLADAFGLTRLSQSYTELETRALEARSLAGRFRNLALTLLSPDGRWQRLVLLFVALAVPVVLAAVVPWILNMEGGLAGFTRNVTAAVSLLGAMAAWLSAQTKRGTDLLNTLEATYESVKKSREKVLSGKEPAEQQAKLDAHIRKEAEAQQALHDAEAKVRAIESELRELAPGRRLLKFLEQRSGANDYRQHLGLVSLVRRDFKQLSSLLQEGAEFKDGDSPMLDRIVLYIDDLDRCKSSRVIEVLEAVHLLLSFPIFAVVVAVDPRWLRKSLLEHYPKLLASGRSRNGGKTEEGRDQLASPLDYLEKIFQVPFQLQPIERDGFDRLVDELLPVDWHKPKAEAPASVNVAALANPAPTSTMQSGGAAASPTASSATAATTPQSNAGAAQQPEIRSEVHEASQATTVADPKPPEPKPVIPMRLKLEYREHRDLKSCQPLFRTPRAVKRLANTYCLIRTGVEEIYWDMFIGAGSWADDLPEYRYPLLMLAVAAAYPALAREHWFGRVIELKTWTPQISSPHPDWDALMKALAEIEAEKFAPFDEGKIQYWLPLVKRYSF
ncbi:MAG: hypothetical protein HS117_18085 [Verrucomicrobiaceae bacterium]|nr:hypothetical protein [Verrucomicrobiaceae bacterium]